MSGKKETAPRLGRGLAALLGDVAVKDRHTTPVPLSACRLTCWSQTRSSRAAPSTLSHSMNLPSRSVCVGSCSRLLVRPHPATPDRYQIVAGERRWRAAGAAGLHEVPALVREMADTEAAAVALVENLQRQDLNAIDEAEGYDRLITQFGLTQDALGQAVGKSRSHVANMLRLLNLPTVGERGAAEGRDLARPRPRPACAACAGSGDAGCHRTGLVGAADRGFSKSPAGGALRGAPTGTGARCCGARAPTCGAARP